MITFSRIKLIRIFIRDAIIGALIGLVVLMAGLFLLMLNGPVNVSFLKNYIVAQIEQELPAINFTMNELDFSWNGRDHPLTIRATEVRLVEKHKLFQANVPDLFIEFNAKDIFLGKLNITDIRLDNPWVEISLADPMTAPEEKPLAPVQNTAIPNPMLNLMDIDPVRGSILDGNWMVMLDGLFNQAQLQQLEFLELRNAVFEVIDHQGVMRASYAADRLTFASGTMNKRTLSLALRETNLQASSASAALELTLEYDSSVTQKGANAAELMLDFKDISASTLQLQQFAFIPQFGQDFIASFSDQTRLTGNMRASIDPLGMPIAADLGIKLDEATPLLTANLALNFNQGIQAINAKGIIASDDIAALSPFMPELILSKYDFALAGDAMIEIDLMVAALTKIERLSAQIAANRLEITPQPAIAHLLSAPLALEQAKLDFNYENGEMLVKQAQFFLADLAHSPNPSPQFRLSATISGLDLDAAAGLAAAPYKIDMSAQLTDYKMEWLKGQWPQIIFPITKAWVTENIKIGSVPAANLFASLAYDPRGKTLKIDTLSGDIEVQNSIVNYLDGMPVARGASGKIEYDMKQFLIHIDKADIGDVKLNGGTITFRDFGKTPRLDMMLEASGTAQSAVRLLKSKPFQLYQNIKNPPVIEQGKFDGTFAIGAVLGKEIGDNQLTHKADFNLTDMALSLNNDQLPNRIIADQATLNIDQNGLVLAGDAVYHSSIPIHSKIHYEYFFDPDAAYQDRLQAEGRISRAQIEALGIDPARIPPLFTQGNLAYKLERGTPTIPEKGIDYTVAADFTNAALAFDQLGFDKPLDQASTLSFRVNQRPDQLEFTEIQYDDNVQNHFRGMMVLDPQANFISRQLKMLELQQLRLGQTVLDRVDAAVDDQARLRFTLNGDHLHYQAADPKAKPADQAADADQASALHMGFFDEFEVVNGEITVKSLGLAGLGSLPNISAQFDYRKGEFEQLELSASNNQGQNQAPLFSLVLDRAILDAVTLKNGDVIRRADQARALHITGESLDLLAKQFALDEKFGGNDFSLEAIEQAIEADQASVFRGNVAIDSFSIKNMPAMTKLLQALSLTGILQAFSTQGLEFANLSSDFTFKDNQISNIDALADGFSMGITATGGIDLGQSTMALEGVVIPANTLNKVIPRIPLLREILTGVKREGVFATRYKMMGALEDPVISSSAFSTLTPGFLRDIFGVFYDAVTLPQASVPTDANPTDTNPTDVISRDGAQADTTPTNSALPDSAPQAASPLQN
ncbi:MAG: AsmA-like C-terminal domain-containing protein [Alphaproteobacteria bacterium]